MPDFGNERLNVHQGRDGCKNLGQLAVRVLTRSGQYVMRENDQVLRGRASSSRGMKLAATSPARIGFVRQKSVAFSEIVYYGNLLQVIQY